MDRRPVAIARETAYASIGLVVTAAERARARLRAAGPERSAAGRRAVAGASSVSTEVTRRATDAARQAVERSEPVVAAVRAHTPEPVARAVHDSIARARRMVAAAA